METSIFKSDMIVSRIDSVMSADSSDRMNYFFDRPHHALIYKVSGVMACWYHDSKVEFSQNNIVYIPKGMTYRSQAVSEPPGQYILINFDTVNDTEANDIIVAEFENHSTLCSLFQKCADEWIFKDSAHLYSCRGYVYRILALMAKALDGSDAESRRRIQPSLDYMRLHISDSKLNDTVLAELSGLGLTQFRRLFKRVFMVTPSHYITSVRIGRAKDLLHAENGSSHLMTIPEIAETVGFADSGTFSRQFRMEVGMSPSQWREL